MPIIMLAVPDFPGYKVGHNGTVWTAWNNGGRITNEWVQMKPKITKAGYCSVGLRKDGKKHCKMVHRLVLEAFVGPCPVGMECRHLDGNKQSNRNTNLKWGTKQENAADKILHGTDLRGEDQGNSTLTNEDVLKIVQLLNQRVPQATIAKQFKVVQSTIKSIALSKTWIHLTKGLLIAPVGHWTKRPDADEIKKKSSESNKLARAK